MSWSVVVLVLVEVLLLRVWCGGVGLSFISLDLIALLHYSRRERPLARKQMLPREGAKLELSCFERVYTEVMDSRNPPLCTILLLSNETSHLAASQRQGTRHSTEASTASTKHLPCIYPLPAHRNQVSGTMSIKTVPALRIDYADPSGKGLRLRR